MALLIFAGSLLLSMFIGLPIAFSLIICALSLMYFLDMTDIQIITQNMWNGANNFPLLAVPFFMLAGEFMNAGGMTKRIIGIAMTWVGHVRGGMGYVAVFAAIIMASLSGSAAADTAALAAILLPMMREAGYKLNRTGGLIGAGGIIAPVIPPSVAMILYGVTGQISITKLFLAGIVPGIIMGIGLLLTWRLLAKSENVQTSPKSTLRERVLGAVATCYYHWWIKDWYIYPNRSGSDSSCLFIICRRVYLSWHKLRIALWINAQCC